MSGRTVRWLLSLVRPPLRARLPRLTIVRHHRVYGAGERPLYRLGVSESVLEAQIALLAAAGMTPLTVGEGLARLAAGGRRHWVAFTFDDGYADNVERALPLLRRHGAAATFYLTAGWMDERRPAWWDELAHALERPRVAAIPWPTAAGETWTLDLSTPAARVAALQRLLPELRLEPAARAAALTRLRAATGAEGTAACDFATWPQAAQLAEAGMEIGAHTLDHPHLSLLAADRQVAEIGGSIALIERRLGLRPTGFAFPGGDFDAGSLAAVRASGVAHAVLTRAGDVLPSADPFTLRRRGLSEGACLGPRGRFSQRMVLAEIHGAFDRLRGTDREAA